MGKKHGGWYNERQRHRLAARRIKTAMKKPLREFRQGEYKPRPGALSALNYRGDVIEMDDDGYWLVEDDNHRVWLDFTEAGAKENLDKLKDNPDDAPYLVPDFMKNAEEGMTYWTAANTPEQRRT